MFINTLDPTKIQLGISTDITKFNYNNPLT